MNIRHGDLESLLANFKGGGWDALEGMSDEVTKRLKLKEEQDEGKKRAIASAWARFAASPDGELALQALLDSTLNRTAFFVNLQLPPAQTAIWGGFREGQNAIAVEILRQISIGRGDETQPKPRETPA
jgi:hypothetical protein